MKRAGLIAAILVLLGSTLPLRTVAQARRTTWEGVYSPDQALRGQVSFQSTCAACHGVALEGGAAADAPALRRDNFLIGWDLRRLFTFISRQMPPNAPGSLTADEYREVVAYLLKENGFPAGQADLPSDPAALEDILITSGPSQPAVSH